MIPGSDVSEDRGPQELMQSQCAQGWKKFGTNNSQISPPRPLYSYSNLPQGISGSRGVASDGILIVYTWLRDLSGQECLPLMPFHTEIERPLF